MKREIHLLREIQQTLATSARIEDDVKITEEELA